MKNLNKFIFIILFVYSLFLLAYFLVINIIAKYFHNIDIDQIRMQTFFILDYIQWSCISCFFISIFLKHKKKLLLMIITLATVIINVFFADIYCPF
jgi:hypothetical protein